MGANPPTGKLRVHLRTLGCPKNQVDSELMLGALDGRDFSTVTEAGEADVLLVNTCGFIEPARRASVDAILDLAEHKRARPGARLVVTGCLSQQHADALAEELPEVDLFLGSGDATRVAGFVGELVDAGAGPKPPRVRVGRPGTLYDPDAPRLPMGPAYSAYVKIAEGCSQRCRFCIIPRLRGKARSRSLEYVEAEVASLAAQGVREVNLIAQDLTHYGEDLRDSGRTTLSRLLDRLVRVRGIRWIRLMYCYPHNLDERLLEHLGGGGPVVPYLDLPLQHADDAMLTAMARRVSAEGTRSLLDLVRERVPGIFLRTTFIVGFPGESRRHMRHLIDFCRDLGFDHAGAFAYSHEPGTPSARDPEQVPEQTRRRRADRLGEVLREASVARARERVGEIHEAVVEAVGPETGLYLGRHWGQAPEVDGHTLLRWDGAPLAPGTFVRARITHANDLDPDAQVVDILDA